MNDSIFPKRIGIIFLEKLKKVAYKQKYKPRHSKDLDFEQVACAHLILQMNSIQSLFDFQIITLFEDEDKEFYIDKEKITLDNFDKEIAKMEKLANTNEENKFNKFKKIDYWIGITSKTITDVHNNEEYSGHFLTVSKQLKGSKKLLGLITSKDWNKKFSPPSLFEYIVFCIFICGIFFLNYDCGGTLRPHKDKGCLCDYTYYKPNRRISITNPNLCLGCSEKLEELESLIETDTKKNSNLIKNVKSVLDHKWMGSPDERNTPLYNLKKNYRYDTDRNSGFHKGQIEKFRDSIIDKFPEWTVGTIILGIMGTISVMLGIDKLG